jgi:hypothetical protein
MKKQILLLGVLLCVHTALKAQQVPTINQPPNGGQNDPNFWARSGNLGTGGNINNIFGTKWNSPIYTVTGSFNAQSYRMKVNGVFTGPTQYSINGFTTGVNTTGYVLIGQNNNSMSDGLSIYQNKGAFSLLHLNGPGTVYQEYGYRPWMQTGITLTGNKDLSYFGLRKLSTLAAQEDITETVLLWSDNSLNSDGPDRLVFRFAGFGGTDGNSVNANRLSNTDLDGLHVAQFTGTGLMGLGNTFGVNATGMAAAAYIDPQSLMHMSYDRRNGAQFESYGFMQMTYRDATGIIGSGETSQDGLRLGIDNDIINLGGVSHLSGYLRWQENSPFIIQSDWDNSAGGIQNGERMRIATVSSPGVPNPGLNANTTRVAISHNGAQPVTAPRSLLHLGYNTGLNSQTSGAVDGWRPWMDIGTFTTNGTDNIYVGLKSEGTDRHDAVINWGDNQNGGLTGTTGPDNLRFIFTSTTTGFPPGDAISESVNGLEVARMEPTLASTLPNTNYGMVGIGNFSPTSTNVGALAVDAKLDIDGDLRIRTVTENQDLVRVLVIDPNDLNRVHWKAINTSNSGYVACSDNTGAANLTSDSKINLNNQNFYFENNDLLNENHVGIGYDCSQLLPAKLSVFQTHPTTVNESTTSFSGLNSDVTNTILTTYTGVHGIANGEHPPLLRTTNRGGAFLGTGADVNYGVYAEAQKASTENWQNMGGSFIGTDGIVAIGLWGTGRGGELRSIGVSGQATSPNSLGNPPSTLENIGGQFVGSYSDGNNYGVFTVGNGGQSAYGVYTTANGGVNNWAAYCDGLVETTIPPIVTSDAQFKTDVNKIENALGLISKLEPRTYKLDTINYDQFRFTGVQQYGFIAQEVQVIMPELIHQSKHPGVYDSLGIELVAPMDYLAMNYNAIIPINTQAIRELNLKMERSTLSDETIKTNVSNISGSLDKVLQMRGVTYEWTQSAQEELELDNEVHIGFIAQEMNQIEPMLSFYDADSLMHVRYDKIVPLLVGSIQELTDRVTSKDSIIEAQGNEITNLNERLTLLENCLSNLLPALCQANQMAVQQTPQETQEYLEKTINITLSSRNNIILNQNVPNPFAESTVISYSIPSTVQKAQLHFYDGQGKLINTVEISERGNGQVNVFANDLSTGVYTYSLVADGQVVATKRMMKN